MLFDTPPHAVRAPPGRPPPFLPPIRVWADVLRRRTAVSSSLQQRVQANLGEIEALLESRSTCPHDVATLFSITADTKGAKTSWGSRPTRAWPLMSTPKLL